MTGSPAPTGFDVQDSGGLPEYICEIARAISRGGKSISTSIQIAVSRVKRWAAGLDDVDADTRAKAAKAVAQWEAMKAKSKGKTAAKKAAKRGRGSDRDKGKADLSYVIGPNTAAVLRANGG